MSPRSIRLALCGSAGVGKTTLGRALARRFEVPFIEEGMRRRLEAGLVPGELAPQALEDLFAELWQEQLEAQLAAVDTHGGYVADRSAFDFGAAWLQYTSLEDRQRTSAWMLARLTDAEEHTHVVLLPFGGLPLEGDGIRHDDPWFQFRFQAVVEHLLARHARKDVCIPVPPACQALEDRIAFVEARLATPSP